MLYTGQIRTALYGCAILFLLLAMPVFAVDSEQAISVEADKATIDDLKRITRYQGNVEVVQGSTRIKAASMVFHYSAERDLEFITAEGDPVHFRRLVENSGNEIIATAQEMKYDALQDMLHLSGKAQIKQGADTFAGENIDYDGKRSLITAGGKGSQRVSVTIQPRNVKKTGDGGQ